MKNKTLSLIILFVLISTLSCDEPLTVVTNIVHSDGSVTRMIEMRNSKNSFNISELQVPFDQSWKITDSVEIGGKGDTTWVKRAIKDFKNVEEINLSYSADSGKNGFARRNADFRKSFRWFNNVYRFSESVDRILSYGHPVKDFMNSEQLQFFYSPDSEQEAKKNGPDSLKFRAISDSVSACSDKWIIKNFVSQWIGEFSKLASEKDGIREAIETLKKNEDELIRDVTINESAFDSLWSNGTILNKFLGNNGYQKYKTEADSAIDITTNLVLPDFANYSVRIVMPGKLTGSNGFADSSNTLVWPVKADFFMTEPYVMWAESKVPNTWAWIISGLFLLFVFTGVVIRSAKKKKGRTTSLS
jgi:hypothetical protein